MLKIPTQHKFSDLLPSDNSTRVNAKTQTCIPFSSILKQNKHIKDGGNFAGRFSQSFEGFPCFLNKKIQILPTLFIPELASVAGDD